MCKYIYVKGKKKGQKCTINQQKGDYCSYHKKIRTSTYEQPRISLTRRRWIGEEGDKLFCTVGGVVRGKYGIFSAPFEWFNNPDAEEILIQKALKYLVDNGDTRKVIIARNYTK